MSGEEVHQNEEIQQPLDEGMQSLADMPEFSEHVSQSVEIESFDSKQPVGEDVESKVDRETIIRLRNKFLNEDYGRFAVAPSDNHPFSSVQAISGRLNDLEYKYLQEIVFNNNPKQMSQLAQLAEHFTHHTKAVAEKIIGGEWSPTRIEEQYGDKVEKYGISLADINAAMAHRSAYDDEYPYDIFCRNLPNIIEKHFSDQVSEENKKTMASIVRKISHDRLYDFNEDTTDQPTPTLLSEQESDFIAKLFVDANKAKGRSVEDVCNYKNLRGEKHISVDLDVKTDDLLLDGIINNLDYFSRSKYQYEGGHKNKGNVDDKIKKYITDPSKIQNFWQKVKRSGEPN